ncbi:flagellin N-terminal helical domain-containing protein [Dongia sedimenti]|uniref:Flagellin n=1 Tax=Dongia sedimenti TaxID=3064282 RepID=A0ABU0YJ23_9PROT|nr:flagellin [Rhodospirillaceae bacterium R-7]
MANSVQLTASIRSNLLLLQTTQTSLDRTQTRLSTGNKVNSALDSPTAFFAAKSLNQRASDLTSLKDGIGQAISTINAGDTGISAIQSLIDRANALTQSALSNLGTDANSVETRQSLAQQYNAILRQIDKQAGDASYAGKNLLVGSGLRLGVTASSQLDVNALAGISGATVTNVTKADTYTVSVAGDGAISGDAGDIANAANDRGISNIVVNGFASTSKNTLSDITVKLSGGEGKDKTFTVTEGDESFTTTFTQAEWKTAKDAGTVLKFSHSFASGTNLSFDVDFDSIEDVPDTAGVGTSTIQKNINLQVSVSNLAGETVTRDGLQSVGNGKVSDGENSFSFGTGTARVTLDERQILQASTYTAAASGAYGTGAAAVNGTPTLVTTTSVTVDETFNLTATASNFNYATGNFDLFSVSLDGQGSAGLNTKAVSVGNANNVGFTSTGAINGGSIDISFNYNELKYIATAAAAASAEIAGTIQQQSGASGTLSSSPFTSVGTVSGFAANQVSKLSVDVTIDTGGSAHINVSDGLGGSFSTVVTAASASAAGGNIVSITIAGGTNAGAKLNIAFADSALSQQGSAGTAASHAAFTVQVRGAYTQQRDAKFDVRGAHSGTDASLTTKQLVDASDQNNLTVQLNETNTSIVNVVSQNVQTNGQGLAIDQAQNNWGDRSDIQNAIEQLTKASNLLRTASSNLGTNLGIIQTRQDFTSEFANVLTEGASKLTQADQNEESANMLTLQTRQQLGTIALSLANQAQQAILRLF